MRDIVIELSVSEAQQVLAAVTDRQLTSSTLAAISTGDEHEIADVSAKMLGQVATRLVDALYPSCGASYPHEWHRGCAGVPGMFV